MVNMFVHSLRGTYQLDMHPSASITGFNIVPYNIAHITVEGALSALSQIA